jgi:secreted trypsin-like serine protease
MSNSWRLPTPKFSRQLWSPNFARPASSRWLMLLMCLLSGLLIRADAIVTRHDTGYSNYLASEADYPAVFPLEVQARRKVCVATLIAAQWAITAAHCAYETSLQSTLAQGQAFEVQISGEPNRVTSLLFHPQWPGTADTQLRGEDVDLALLRLERPPSVPALALYRDQQELGQVLKFLGWGYSGIGRTGIRFDDGRLRFARNTVVQADQWLRFRFDDPGVPDSGAVEYEGVPGLGDSGGPALLNVAGQWYLAGVAIGELSPENRRRPGVYGAEFIYERVSRHLQWIDAVISANPDPWPVQ